jgi:hypothetical protein
MNILVKSYFKVSIFCLLFGIKAFAQEMPVPATLQGELLPKILMLNKGFASKKVIVVGIIYSNYLRSSIETYHDVAAKLKNAQLGISFKIVPIEISETTNFKQVFLSDEIDCIYIAPVRGIDLAVVNKACKDLNILSVSAIPAFVLTYFSIGFDLVNEKPKIIVSQKSIDSEGIVLSSRLLKISKIYP